LERRRIRSSNEILFTTSRDRTKVTGTFHPGH
jgi:hypothetical protein